MKSRLQPDWNYLVGLASVAVTAPFAMAAIAHVKGAEVGSGWFYTLLPGMAMAICGTIGNSMVVSAAMTMRGLSKGVTRGLWAIFGISLLATTFVLGGHMVAQYRQMTLVELLGPWLFGLWCVCLFTMVDLQAPGNFVVSALKRQAAAEAAESRQAVAQGAATPALIQEALQGRSRQTIKELAATCDVGHQAITSALNKMKAQGTVVGVHDIEHGRAKVWSLKEAA